MASLLHIDTGTVDLGNGNFLKSGLSVRQVEELGIPFIRGYHAGAGWQIKSLKPVQIGGNVMYLTLTFHQDHITKLAISFLEQEQDAKLMQRNYTAFLKQELGEPSTVLHGRLSVMYQYDWGQISSTYDPRNGSSAIHVSWAKF